MADKKNEDKEIRLAQGQVSAVAEDSRKVEGYALLFGVKSTDLWFEEVIERGAIDENTILTSDVFALMNHDRCRGVLARSKQGVGSLELTIDEKGLKYSFEAPKTALGDELLENIRRGEIDSSSFGFRVESDTWVWDEAGSGADKRTVHKIAEIYDVSPVYTAAYAATTVCLRGLEAVKEEHRAAKKRDQEERQAAYLSDIKKKYNYQSKN